MEMETHRREGEEGGGRKDRETRAITSRLCGAVVIPTISSIPAWRDGSERPDEQRARFKEGEWKGARQQAEAASDSG